MFQQGTESPWATQRQRWQLDSLKLSPAAGHLPQALLVVPTLASLHPVTYLCFLCLHQARLAGEQAYLFVKYDRLPKKPLAQQCWQPIVTAQTGGGIMFSGCPSVRLSVCYTNCEHDILKTREPSLMPVGTKWSTGQGHETVKFGIHEVKGQGQTTPTIRGGSILPLPISIRYQYF